MLDKDQILNVVNEYISGKDIFVVDIKISTTSVIEVIIDSMIGISVDTCIDLTRFIESRFDRNIEDYELTVGSHSISDQFKVEAHYHKNIGREVEVILKNGDKFQGILETVSKDGIVVKFQVKEAVEGKKRKVLVDVVRNEEFEAIKSVKLIIKF